MNLPSIVAMMDQEEANSKCKWDGKLFFQFLRAMAITNRNAWVLSNLARYLLVEERSLIRMVGKFEDFGGLCA